MPARPRLAELALSVSLLAAVTFPSAAQETQPAEPTPAEAAEPAEPAPAEAAQPAAPAQLDPNKVVATIGGQPITEADMALALASVDQQYAQLPPEQRRAAAFMAVMEIKLMAARAVAEGLDKDPDFEKRMAFLRDRALHSEVIDKDIAANITDEEVRARYDKQISETPPVNEVRARHILVETKEQADAIVKQLDGGADFVTLANENTKDPSGKTSGGDLGYFAPGQMVPEFEKAAFALEVGGYTKEPVQTQFGWHIIKVEDKRAQQPPTFESMKDQTRNLVFREKYFAMVDQLRKDGNVDITDAELKKAVDAMDAANP
ncbi:MAG: peptidylprolyl isomerase [Mesorhizobium sp.]|nr:peptidylprolyl isomerase [Mesorhizobium sp.]